MKNITEPDITEKAKDEDILKAMDLRNKAAESIKVKNFINRIMNLPTDLQGDVFDAFDSRRNQYIEDAKNEGTYDMGVEVVPVENAEVVDSILVNVDEKSGAETYIKKIKAKREVKKYKWEYAVSDNQGFYLNKNSGNIFRARLLEGTHTDARTGRVGQRYQMQSVKTGSYVMKFELENKDNWEKIESEERAKGIWEKLDSETSNYSDTTVNMVTGAILPIYGKLGNNQDMTSIPKVQRLMMDDGTNILGMVISRPEYEQLLSKLGIEGGIKKEDIPPKALLEHIKNHNSMAVLNDGTRIARRRVSGENRIVVTPPRALMTEFMRPDGRMQQMGFQMETIDHKRNAFLPNTTAAESILERYMANLRVEQVTDNATGADVMDDIKFHRPFMDADKLANDYSIEIHRELSNIVARIAPFANLDIDRQTGAPYSGSYKRDPVTLKALITVALNTGDDPRRIVRHEVIHPLRELGMFTDEEWSVLKYQAIKEDWAGKYRIKDRYPELFNGDQPTEAAYEEAIADDYSFWGFNKEKNAKPASTIVGRIYQRITRFFQLLTRYLRSFGATPTVDSIYDKVERGVVGRRKPKQRKGSGKKKYHVKFSDPETESRWESAATGVTLKTSGKIRESLSDAFNLFTRTYKHLPNRGESKTYYAQFHEWAYYVTNSTHASKEKIREYLEGVTKDLSPLDLDLLTRKWVLDDLLWMAEQGKQVPFGYADDANGLAADKILEDLQQVEAELAERPELQNRYDLRNKMRDRVTKEMLAVGVLTPEQARNPNYFHHQVLEYAATMTGTGKTSGKAKTPFWHKRFGSDKDINANYYQAESEWLFKALTDIATTKFLRRLRTSKYNIAQTLKKKTREANEAAMKEEISRDPKVAAAYSKRKQAIGISLSYLRNESNDYLDHVLAVLPKKMQSSFLSFVNSGHASAEGLDYDLGRTGIFRLLDALRDQNMPQDVRKQAEIVFASFLAKKRFMRDTLGERYIDPTNMEAMANAHLGDKRDKWRIWQPDARGAGDRAMTIYTAQTLPEHVLDRAMLTLEETVNEVLTPEQASAVKEMLQGGLRDIQAIGGPKEQMVLPVPIAETLNEFHDKHVENMLDELAIELQARWKQWILFQPLSLIKYNLNNVTGDSDAIIATGTAKEMFAQKNIAFREVYQMIYNNKLTDNLKDALDMGVIQSSLIAQELNEDLVDIGEAFNPTAKAEGILAQIKKTGKSYFSTVTKVTRLRENAFRYASYLVMLERMKKMETLDRFMTEYGYVATPPETLKGLTDNKEIAARLARDMMGDYGNIPVAAKWARKRMIPFVSWIASNTIRYNNLIRNAYLYSRDVGKRKGIPQGALTAGLLGSSMFAIYAMVNLWNNLIMDEQEEELSDESRLRLHLNLGKYGKESYSLRFQGALSDYLGWFGLEDAGAVMMDHANGRADARDVLASMAKAPVNKIAQGISPFYKVPAEFVTGAWFPDVFNPRPVHDKARHIGSAFKLDSPVAWTKELLGYSAPSDNLWETILQAVVYKHDPGKIAFDNVRSMGYDFLAHETGGGGGAGRTGPKAKSLRNLRRAMAMDDKKSARLARIELRRMGERRPWHEVLQTNAPLSMLNRQQTAKFMRTLSAKEQNWVRMANKWHRATVYGGN